MIRKLLEEFIKEIQSGNIEIYNEFSLQHELGIYLRKALPAYKVEFERNVKFFNISNTVKKEIDIVVYDDNVKFAIELKNTISKLLHPRSVKIVKFEGKLVDEDWYTLGLNQVFGTKFASIRKKYYLCGCNSKYLPFYKNVESDKIVL